MYFTERSDWLKKTNTDSDHQKNTARCEKFEFILFHYNFKFRILTLKTETFFFLNVLKYFFTMCNINMFNIESDNLHSTYTAYVPPSDTSDWYFRPSITTRRYSLISDTLKYGFKSCLCRWLLHFDTVFNIISPLQLLNTSYNKVTLWTQIQKVQL